MPGFKHKPLEIDTTMPGFEHKSLKTDATLPGFEPTTSLKKQM